MPDIHIERRHALGLPLARQIARRWIGRLESDFRLQCRYEEGSPNDQVAVQGLGVAGWVVVNARFLQVQLDLRFPLVALRSMIEQRIARELDEELDGHTGAPDAPKRRAPAKKVAAKKVAAKKAAPKKTPPAKAAPRTPRTRKP
ncbi:polyhydroxyalkanoic acid system family protein [Xenophilus sp.]|uniref:polyhydroxyalkanoic acid system family protein n=1 Tax=Xenophilus sp. TaxID=1873499 RepID=UPI0037DDDB97